MSNRAGRMTYEQETVAGGFRGLSGARARPRPPPIRAFLRSATAFRTLETCSRTLAGTIPLKPYVDGHFSNGPTWVEDLSQMLGLGR